MVIESDCKTVEVNSNDNTSIINSCEINNVVESNDGRWCVTPKGSNGVEELTEVPSVIQSAIEDAVNGITADQLRSELQYMLEGYSNGIHNAMLNLESENKSLHAQIEVLKASVGQAQSSIVDINTVYADREKTLAQSIEYMESKFGASESDILDFKQTYADSQKATADKLISMSAVRGDAEAKYNEAIGLEAIQNYENHFVMIRRGVEGSYTYTYDEAVEFHTANATYSYPDMLTIYVEAEYGDAEIVGEYKCTSDWNIAFTGDNFESYFTALAPSEYDIYGNPIPSQYTSSSSKIETLEASGDNYEASITQLQIADENRAQYGGVAQYGQTDGDTSTAAFIAQATPNGSEFVVNADSFYFSDGDPVITYGDDGRVSSVTANKANPVFSIINGSTQFNGTVTIGGLPNQVNKDWTTTPPSANPISGVYSAGDTYFNSVTQLTMYYTDSGWATTKGDNAEIYMLQSSAGIMSKTVLNEYTPTSITFTSKKSNGSTFSDYSGRFKIYEGTSLKYTSSANESSKIYTPTSTATSIKCDMYAAGGTTTLLDTVTVPVSVEGLGLNSTNPIVSYYVLSDDKTTIPSGYTNDTGDWSTTLISPTSTSPYLWSYDKTTYSDNSVERSLPIITAYYTKDGKSLTSIVEEYATSATATGSKTLWSTTVPVLNATTKKFLWNRTKVNYVDGDSVSSYEYAPSVFGAIVGVYGDGTVTAVLSNDNHSIPTDSAGTVSVSSYTGSGTNIQVFDGAVALTYKHSTTTSLANGEWKVTSIDTTGVGYIDQTTDTIITGTGTTTATVDAISSFTADAGSVTFNITGFTKYGQSFTTSVVQSFSKAKSGSSGVSITGVTNYYLATNSSSGITKDTSGWTTTVQPLTATNPYLWNYESVAYSSGDPTETAPTIIGYYTQDGKSITGITQTWAANNSNTTAPTTGWSSSMPTLNSSTAKYLWEKQVIYIDSVAQAATYKVVGVYGDTSTVAGPRGAMSLDIDILYNATDTDNWNGVDTNIVAVRVPGGNWVTTGYAGLDIDTAKDSGNIFSKLINDRTSGTDYGIYGDSVTYTLYYGATTDGAYLPSKYGTRKAYCTGNAWNAHAELIVHGNAIVTGSLSSDVFAGNVIYNLVNGVPATESTYTMKIDLENGSIHIK